MAHLHIQSIQSLNLPGLEPYLTMKRPLDHQKQGIFVAEGEKVVRRLLESHLTVVSLLLPEKWLQEYEPLLRDRTEEIHVYLVDKKLLENLTGFPMYQGVLAVGKIPSPVSLETTLQTCRRPFLLVAVEGITNATNLGVLVRNAMAFGVHAFIVGETCCSPFLRRAVRNSMGTIFRLPMIELVETENLIHTLEKLKSRNMTCIAAHPRADSKTLFQCDFTKDVCIVFGGEGYGLSSRALETCDEIVAIPMAHQVDSLNVASAATAFLYEANRQRGNITYHL